MQWSCTVKRLVQLFIHPSSSESLRRLCSRLPHSYLLNCRSWSLFFLRALPPCRLSPSSLLLRNLLLPPVSHPSPQPLIPLYDIHTTLIDKNNDRTEKELKNQDWSHNPREDGLALLRVEPSGDQRDNNLGHPQRTSPARTTVEDAYGPENDDNQSACNGFVRYCGNTSPNCYEIG